MNLSYNISGDEEQSNTRMARAVGNLEAFDPKRHNFPKYVQRVKLYFTANDIPDVRKKSVFLSALG